MNETEAVPRRKSRWRRRLLIATGVFSLVLILLAFLFPYLLKRYIETHSEEWIGRKVTIGRIVLNPFTLTYGIDRFVCHEPKSDVVFVSWTKVYVKSNFFRALRSGNWLFRDIEIRDPYFHIVQSGGGDRFNFSDLMELGGGGSSAENASGPPIVFTMENITVVGGRIDYASDLLHEPVGIVGLHAACTRITSQSARMDLTLGFAMEKGGDINGAFMIDTERSLYAVNGHIKGFALSPLLPYLQDFMHTTALKGTVDLDLDLQDSWVDSTALAASAVLGLNGVGFTDMQGERLLEVKSGHCDLDTLVARTSSFKLRALRVDGLYTRYELFADGSDTWSKALKWTGDTAAVAAGTAQVAASEDNVFLMLADYIRLLGQDFIANEYNADSVVFTNGEVVYGDFTTEKPFRYTLNEMDMRSVRFGTGSGGVEFTASATLNGSGKLTGSMSFDPHDYRNVKMDMSVKGMALQDVDAYSRWYAAHPLDDGVLDYTTLTSLQNGQLDSKNTMRVDRLKFGKKVDAHAAGIYELPLRLAAGLLKDKNGVIELDIPVKGDVRDPKFRVWPIIWQILKNLVSKAAAAPVKLIQGLVGGEAKDLEQVQFEMLQSTIAKDQRKALEQLGKALQAKPELSVKLVPIVDTLQEKEELAAFEIKRRFLGYNTALAAVDSARIIGLSLRDTAFTQYLDVNSPTTKGSPERTRCMTMVGKADVDARWKILEQARQQAVVVMLTKELAIAAEKILIGRGTHDETSGFVGRPGYRFIYDAAP